MPQTNIKQNYRDFTDKYFLRTRHILETEGINPLVRYQVFARKPGTVKGLDEAVGFVKSVAGDKVKVYALQDGQPYASCEPLMKLEGRVQDLVELETVYLGMISAGLTGPIKMDEVSKKAKAIVQAAQGKPVFYFGARHFHYSLDEEIARRCQEQGFVGASTDVGAKAWNAKGIGTIPHALVVSYAAYMQENNIDRNPTVEAARAFDRVIDKNIPRIVLIDTFNREVKDSIETAQAVPSLKGVRIDTCGENYAECSWSLELPTSLDVEDKYKTGKGVTIAALWALRKNLDAWGFGNLELTVSSGFNERKTAAFLEADRVYQKQHGKPLFNNIGTGSIANPVMATADIVAYFSENENQWKEMHKVGRPEIQSNRLEVRA